jgi:hypothetical protein
MRAGVPILLAPSPTLLSTLGRASGDTVVGINVLTYVDETALKRRSPVLA